MLKIKDECTGCMACYNICPVSAISLDKNEYGFIIPVIDEARCINCGMCDKVCPIEGKASHILPDEEFDKEIEEGTTKKVGQMPLGAFSMYHKDEEVVKISSSGGAFYALAKNVINKGGIVFGSYYDTDKKLCYMTDTDTVSLDKILKSKYVESHIGNNLTKVRKELEKGREVLFCGSPCQAAGVRAFLGKAYDNLLVVDFTCGAVTANAYLTAYLDELEKEHNSRVVELNFRDKKYGWGQYSLYVEFENGEHIRETAMLNPYFFCFLRSSMQRLSCHGCHFSDAHESDIVLADFWRVYQFDVDANDSSKESFNEDSNENSNNRRGISLGLAMTKKGLKALGEVAEYMHIEKLDTEKAAYNLKRRISPRSKLGEIFTDQRSAYVDGVSALRDRLLTDDQKELFKLRQYFLDNPEEKIKNPEKYEEIVGRGQIVF